MNAVFVATIPATGEVSTPRNDLATRFPRRKGVAHPGGHTEHARSQLRRHPPVADEKEGEKVPCCSDPCCAGWSVSDGQRRSVWFCCLTLASKARETVLLREERSPPINLDTHPEVHQKCHLRNGSKLKPKGPNGRLFRPSLKATNRTAARP